MQKLEKSFEGIDLAADRFGCVVIAGEVGQIVGEMLGGESGDLGNALLGEVVFELY